MPAFYNNGPTRDPSYVSGNLPPANDCDIYESSDQFGEHLGTILDDKCRNAVHGRRLCRHQLNQPKNLIDDWYGYPTEQENPTNCGTKAADVLAKVLTGKL